MIHRVSIIDCDPSMIRDAQEMYRALKQIYRKFKYKQIVLRSQSYNKFDINAFIDCFDSHTHPPFSTHILVNDFKKRNINLFYIYKEDLFIGEYKDSLLALFRAGTIVKDLL